MDLRILFDRSERVGTQFFDVKKTLLIALASGDPGHLRIPANPSATLIPSLSLPMSLVGTFAVMGRLGYTLDNLSLMALTLSIGFVVDDAIVMLENIVRHMEHGENPLEAALNGSRKSALPSSQ